MHIMRRRGAWLSSDRRINLAIVSSVRGLHRERRPRHCRRVRGALAFKRIVSRTRSIAVVAGGHLVDLPGRGVPRFPSSEEDRVRAEIHRTFSTWGVGPGAEVFCGGARGADLLAAEVALEQGANVTLLLALPPEHFIERSVRIGSNDGGAWTERFHRVASRSRLGMPEASAVNEDPFERCNRWLLESALQANEDFVRVLLVWDGGQGDGPGGTAHLFKLVAAAAATVEVIDPRPVILRP